MAAPVGVLEGSTRASCAAMRIVNTGMTVVPPDVTFTLAPFNWLGRPGARSIAEPPARSGSASPEPLMMNSVPWAIPELAKPAGIRL